MRAILLTAVLAALVPPSAAADGADVLSHFFTPEQAAAARAYATASVAGDPVGLFRKAVALEGTLLAKIQAAGRIWPALEEYLDADLGLPGVAPGCVAECTLPALILDSEYFKTRAASTEGNADDAFFDLLADAFARR